MLRGRQLRSAADEPDRNGRFTPWTDTVECSHGGHATHTPDPNSGLGRRALALRGAHILIATVEIASVAHLWVCAITGRRDRALTGAMVVLGIEGAALIVTRGDCPLGPLQARLGDPTPLFELALPPAAAKLAVPALAMVTSVGLGLLIARRPSTEGSGTR
jgi:hypothetical protein